MQKNGCAAAVATDCRQPGTTTRLHASGPDSIAEVYVNQRDARLVRAECMPAIDGWRRP